MDDKIERMKRDVIERCRKRIDAAARTACSKEVPSVDSASGIGSAIRRRHQI